jgi:hypothetical protein
VLEAESDALLRESEGYRARDRDSSSFETRLAVAKLAVLSSTARCIESQIRQDSTLEVIKEFWETQKKGVFNPAEEI